MKKSAILRLTLLAAFCELVMLLYAAFGDSPFQVKPNWFTIVPALAVCSAFVGPSIRKKWRAMGNGGGTQGLAMGDSCRPMRIGE